MDIERLIQRHKDAVYRQLIKTCGSYEEAEDALAEALLAALKSADRLHNPENFQAWLARVGTRICVRAKIRERLLKSISLADLETKGFEIPQSDANPEELAEAADLKECVEGAINLLPETYREVYLRREILGESAEKVAGALHLSIPALKSRLHRARTIMRDNLDSGLGCVSYLD